MSDLVTLNDLSYLISYQLFYRGAGEFVCTRAEPELTQNVGVYAPGGPAFLAHTEQKVSNIVGLTALRLAFFMGYE